MASRISKFTGPTALLLIDIQQGLDEHKFYGGHRNNPDAEANCNLLLNHWRRNNWPVFHVQHSSTNPNSPLYPSKPGFAHKMEVAPLEGEVVFIKQVNSAFTGTGLKEELDRHSIKEVIIVGLTTNHCVSSTARSAADLGFATIVVSDATAAFDQKGYDGRHFDAQLIHEIVLANLNGEFATIATTDELLNQLS